MSQHNPALPELVVVIPVFNEEGAIEAVLLEWMSMLNGLAFDYQLHVYNDGSTDTTSDIVAAVSRAHPRVIFHDRRENRGHGPTILAAYKEHLDVPWIFQTDSDGEIGAEHFPAMWEQREHYDMLLGYRTGRQSPPIRKLATWGARMLVKYCFGGDMRDVNVPYRLMRSTMLKEIVQALPEDIFAPNVLISGVAGQKGAVYHEVPVSWIPRSIGTSSIFGVSGLQSLGVSLCQTVMFLKRIHMKR